MVLTQMQPKFNQRPTRGTTGFAIWPPHLLFMHSLGPVIHLIISYIITLCIVVLLMLLSSLVKKKFAHSNCSECALVVYFLLT